ncbi:GmrSD restriction endonuclease domain-containing protein, partial [Haloferax prahovense]
NISPSAEDIRRVVANARYESSPGEPVFTDTDVTAVLGLIEESYTQSMSASIGDYSVDHIYPKSREETVSESIGETVDVDRIGNLQLLPHEMNEEIKSDQWPHEWLDDLGNAEAERIQRVNQYPDVEPTPENAQAFIQAREEQITDYLIDKYVK